MSYDYSKLQGKIREICITNKQFAKLMELSERSLSLKINNKVPFSQSEIDRAVEILGIKQSDIFNYFFTRKVQNN